MIILYMFSDNFTTYMNEVYVHIVFPCSFMEPEKFKAVSNPTFSPDNDVRLFFDC